MERDAVTIDAPIDVKVSDLPGDIQARVIGTTMRVTYRWFREVWTGKNGFEGERAAEARYRAAHAIANPSAPVRN